MSYDSERGVDLCFSEQRKQKEDQECCKKYCCCCAANASSLLVGCFATSNVMTSTSALNMVVCVASSLYCIFNIFVLPRCLVKTHFSPSEKQVVIHDLRKNDYVLTTPQPRYIKRYTR